MKKNQNNLELLKKIEHLSNIDIEKKKMDDVIGYMDNVCSWFAILSSIDTSNVESAAVPLCVFNSPKNIHCDNILTNEKSEHGYFVVPKVIE